MSGRWWRAYGRARHDPKLLKLSDKQFRWWFSFVCAASDNGGVLPSHADLSVEFRATGKVITEALDALVTAGLFDHDDEGIRPHNWDNLQYKSDTSAERLKRHRERQRSVIVTERERHCDVTVTPSETEQNRTDIPLAKANGHSPPVVQDITAVVFGAGLTWLAQSTGKPEAACRALLGKWRQQSGDEALIAALGRAQREGPIDAVAWMTKALKQPDKVTGWN